MSWNLPADDDIANDVDECRALIKDHDGKDIMQVEHMRNDIPSGKVASPAQFDYKVFLPSY